MNERKKLEKGIPCSTHEIKLSTASIKQGLFQNAQFSPPLMSIMPDDIVRYRT